MIRTTNSILPHEDASDARNDLQSHLANSSLAAFSLRQESGIQAEGFEVDEQPRETSNEGTPGFAQRIGLRLSPWLLTPLLLFGGCSKEEASQPDHAVAGNFDLTLNPKISGWWTRETLDRFIELAPSASWASVNTQKFEMGEEILKQLEFLEPKIQGLLSTSPGEGILVELPQIVYLGKFGSPVNIKPRICGGGTSASEALCNFKTHPFLSDAVFHVESHRTIRSQFIWYTNGGQGLSRQMLVPPTLPPQAASPIQAVEIEPHDVERAIAGNRDYWPHPKIAEWWTADTLLGFRAAAETTTFLSLPLMNVIIDVGVKQSLEDLKPTINRLLSENPGRGVLVEVPQYTYPDTQLVTALPPKVVGVNDSVVSAFCDGKSGTRIEMPPPAAGNYSYQRSQFLWYTGDGKVTETKLVAAPPCGNSTVNLSNGTYKGNVHRGEPWGYGSFVGSDGTRYNGEFRAGKYAGRGKEVLPSGEVYEGEFKGGVKQGLGKYNYKGGPTDGWVYEGEFANNRPQGKGTITGLPDGVSVTGTFEGSIFDGDVAVTQPAHPGMAGWTDYGRVHGSFFQGQVRRMFNDGARAEFDVVNGQIKKIGKFWTKEGTGPLPYPPLPDVRTLLQEAFPNGIPVIGLGVNVPLGGGDVTIKTSVGPLVK